jgi:large subunit ribosomal protein L35
MRGVRRKAAGFRPSLLACPRVRRYKAVLSGRPPHLSPEPRIPVMSKLKTKSGAKKRFKITAKGKVKAQQVGKRHRLISNSPKRTRNLRGADTLAKADAIRAKKWMPYG